MTRDSPDAGDGTRPVRAGGADRLRRSLLDQIQTEDNDPYALPPKQGLSAGTIVTLLTWFGLVAACVVGLWRFG